MNGPWLSVNPSRNIAVAFTCLALSIEVSIGQVPVNAPPPQAPPTPPPIVTRRVMQSMGGAALLGGEVVPLAEPVAGGYYMW